MHIHIRSGNLDDVDWLITQLKKFSTFFGTKKSLFGTEEYAKNGMRVLIQSHLVLIAERTIDGLPLGFIAGCVSPHQFNPDIKVLSEFFWWVDEEYRLSRAGLMLLNAFTDWGKANADWITFALEKHSPVTDKHLIKRGFQLQERSFLLEVGA